MNYSLLVVTIAAAAAIWSRIAFLRCEEAREEAQRQSYRQRIEEDQENAGAFEALGDSLQRAGRLHDAQREYLNALEAGSDQRVYDRTRYKLMQLDIDLRRQAERRAAGPFGLGMRRPARQTYFCAACGAPNPVHNRRCEICDAPLPVDSLWEALQEKETQRAILEGASMIAVLAVCLRIFNVLPQDVQGVLIVSTVAVVAWRLLQSIDGHRRVK